MAVCPMQAFAANGVTTVEPKVGDMMDPNLHEALFDIPNPNQDPGTIAVVTKVLCPVQFSNEPQTQCSISCQTSLAKDHHCFLRHVLNVLQKGYMLNGRVIRPAEVGTVRKA